MIYIPTCDICGHETRFGVAAEGLDCVCRRCAPKPTRDEKIKRALDMAERRASFYYKLYNEFRVKRGEYRGHSDGRKIYENIHDQIRHELSLAMIHMGKRRNMLMALKNGTPPRERPNPFEGFDFEAWAAQYPQKVDPAWRRTRGETTISESAKNGWATRRMNESRENAIVRGGHNGRAARVHIPDGKPVKRTRPAVDTTGMELPL